tara:strand:+ start:466 stop:1260 length:795 start_codon:yes stop_codon:yes gene_type:complete
MKTSEMLYEHIVPMEPAKCIDLSACLERSEDSVENMEEYLAKFREMMGLLKRNPHTMLKKQPLFVWHDRNSACWKFEEHRILHTLHEMLMYLAKQEFDKCEYKKAKVHLSRAVDVCKDMLRLGWFQTPVVKSMPEMQPEYLLALLFRTKGTYCFNMHMFKTSPPVAKMAYKFVEISNALWKKGASKEYETKLKAHYHHAVASTSEDFKDIISHSTAAVEIYNDAKMKEDHETWVNRNNTVHFETPEPVECEVFSLERALQVVGL